MNGEDDKPAEPFDARAASAQVPAAEAALLALIKARREAAAAETARQFAVKSVRGLEPLILDLFDTGASPNVVLNILQQSLPAVAPAELRYALAQVRERYRLNTASAPPPSATRQGTPKPSGTAPVSNRPVPKSIRPTAPATQQTQSVSTTTIPGLPDWADGSDRRDDESQADYALRKHLEGPPEAKRKFIDGHSI